MYKLLVVSAVAALAAAEAEADPWLAYGHYGYGLPYYGLRSYLPGVAGHPGAATSYVARSPQGLGKRSADAEPEAEADADAYYATTTRWGNYRYPAYGHGYGYGYGYPYAYHGYYGKRSADADAEAKPGYVLPYAYAPALLNSYPNWPGVSTPFSSSTCFGCRGKRSADAEPEAEAEAGHVVKPFVNLGHPARYYGYFGYPYAYHGLHYYGKRSAEADAEPGYLAYPGYGFLPYAYGSSGYGISQAHPGGSSSFQHVSRLHGLGKRSAEPHLGYFPYALPYFVPSAVGEVKENANGYSVDQTHPGAASSFQHITRGE